MAIAVTCPECHSQVDAAETVVGKRVKCPECHSPFVARPPKPVAKEPSFDDPPRRPPPAVRPRTPRWVWVLGGLCVLVVVFAVAMLAPRGGSPRRTPPLVVDPPRPAPAVWAAYRGDGFEVSIPEDQGRFPRPTLGLGLFGETVERTAGGFKYTAHARRRQTAVVPPFGPVLDPRFELDQFERVLLEPQFAFRRTDRKVFVFADGPATQVKLDASSEYAVLRFVAAEQRLLVFIVQSQQPLDEAAPEVVKFFQSVKLTRPR